MPDDTPHPGELAETRCPVCDAVIRGTPQILWLDGSRISTGPCCSVHHAHVRAIQILTDLLRTLRARLGAS